MFSMSTYVANSTNQSKFQITQTENGSLATWTKLIKEEVPFLFVKVSFTAHKTSKRNWNFSSGRLITE